MADRTQPRIPFGPPLHLWIVTTLLVLWEAMGCFACAEQIRLGAAATGPVDAWPARYYAAPPAWYNGVYAIAREGLPRIRGKRPDPFAQHILMHVQFTRCLRCATDTPRSRTNLTASRLNSRANRLRCIDALR